MTGSRVHVVAGLWMALAVLLAAAPAAAQTTEDGRPLLNRSGVVEAVDFDGPTVVIEGLRYGFEADARVEIGGTYGAPTMLAPGMKVNWYYVEEPASGIAGRIRYLFQLADDAPLTQY